MRKNTRDWWKFFTHFACGAVLGGVLGMGVWSRPELELFNSMKAGVVCISLGALLVGLAAGIADDEFWESFRK